jgi:hypothetical protein
MYDGQAVLPSRTKITTMDSHQRAAKVGGSDCTKLMTRKITSRMAEMTVGLVNVRAVVLSLLDLHLLHPKLEAKSSLSHPQM